MGDVGNVIDGVDVVVGVDAVRLTSFLGRHLPVERRHEKREALAALGFMGLDAIPHIVAELGRCGRGEVIDDAATVLAYVRECGATENDAEAAFNRAVDTAREVGNWAARIALADAIGHPHPKPGVLGSWGLRLLGRLLDDPDADVRDAAVTSIADAPNQREARAMLSARLAVETNEVVRESIRDAITEMAPVIAAMDSH